MDRLNFINVKGIGPRTVSCQEGHGKTGDVKAAVWWQRKVEVHVGGKPIELNRGSAIDFINANKPKGHSDIDYGGFWGFLFGGGR